MDSLYSHNSFTAAEKRPIVGLHFTISSSIHKVAVQLPLPIWSLQKQEQQIRVCQKKIDLTVMEEIVCFLKKTEVTIYISEDKTLKIQCSKNTLNSFCPLFFFFFATTCICEPNSNFTIRKEHQACHTSVLFLQSLSTQGLHLHPFIIFSQ